MTFVKVSRYFNHQNKLYIDIVAFDGEENDELDAMQVPYIKCNKLLWHVMMGDGVDISPEKFIGVKFTQYKEHFMENRPSSYLFNLSNINDEAAHEAIEMIFEFKHS